MATKDCTMDLDIAFFNELFLKAYPNACEITKKQSKQMLADGVIQIETLFELSISKVGNLERKSVDGMDFLDWSDAKKTSARTYSYGNAYSAPVFQIHNKKGKLRVMCYERKKNKFYYFVFPKSAFKHIKSTSNIEIPFYMDGTPRRIPSRPVFTNWWRYEVDSFEEMANAKDGKELTLTELGNKDRAENAQCW